MAYREGYASDDSTLYSRGSERRHRRRSYSTERPRRPRRSRRHSSHPRAEQKGSSTAGNFVKLGLGVVLVQVVATFVTHWLQDRNEVSEKEHREEKRRAFDKAKAKRRREEEEYEKRRQREEDDESERGRRDWDEREIIIREGRTIGYDVPASGDVDDDGGEVRRIEPAPDDYHRHDGYEYTDDEDDWDDARRRAPSVAARSRSRTVRTKSVTGWRDGRSRSRPAERVT